MILIAHRGNIDGPNHEKENSPDYIREALSNGYHVEIDVWIQSDGSLFLGHDGPQYPTTLDFLKHDKRIICHAKTIPTFQYLLMHDLHCFFHDKDAATLTSEKKIWLYPKQLPCEYGILVMPEWIGEKWMDFVTNAIGNCYGVCSDYVLPIHERLHA